MATKIRRVEYFNTAVRDEPGSAYRILADIAGQGVGLLAFTAVPVGPTLTQLTLFPDDPGRLWETASLARIHLDGPYPALLVQGDDQLGVLADLHEKLYQAGVNVYASNAVTDGKGDFGYIIYVRPDKVDAAARALGI
jgi:hypothetical protein